MNLLKLVFILVASFISVQFASAEEKKWANETELSYVETGGNTDLKTLSAKNALKYAFSPKLGAAWKAGILFAENDGVQTSERYSTDLRLDYGFTRNFFTSLNGGWLSDKFAGIDPRYYVGPVAGYKLLSGPIHLLVAEAGADYVKEEYLDDTSASYLRGRAFVQYDFLFSEKTKFTQTAEYLHDFDNTNNYNYNLVTSIISSLSDNFSLKTSYERKYDNETVAPSPGKSIEKTDTVISITLVINYG